MIRTFIAVEVSQRVKDKLAQDIARFKATAPLVKWSKTENLHLTFKFLGDVKEPDLEDLFDAMAEAVEPMPAFTLEVKGVGAFPNWRHPRVIWAGSGEGEDDAIRLAGLVEDACAKLGYEREHRPYRPHLTLGRVKQPADAEGLSDTVRGLEDKLFGYLDVEAVVVFMSSLRRTGPVYSPMARFELGG